MVVLAQGVLGKFWARAWPEERERLKMDAVADGCLMRAPMPSGRWARVRLDSVEAALSASELFTAYGLARELASIYTTHSARATMLSWCAKADVKLGIRRLRSPKT